MFEIRIVGQDGKVICTMEDKVTPILYADLSPGTIFLAEYCFNKRDGPWVKPERLLQDEDVAAVVFNRRGYYDSMVVGGDKVQDRYKMGKIMHTLKKCVLTHYAGKDQKDLFMFYLPDHIKKILADPPRIVKTVADNL